MVKEITKEEFATVVLKNSVPVVVDFWASWCGPCRMLAPVLAELEQEIPNVVFVKIDTEKYPDIASQYGIMSLPTLLVMKTGTESGRISGFKPKPHIKEDLKKLI